MTARGYVIVFAATVLAACSATSTREFDCESGHTLTVRIDEAVALVNVDGHESTYARVSAHRYAAAGRELRMDGEGPRLIQADQVTVWGCVPRIR